MSELKSVPHVRGDGFPRRNDLLMLTPPERAIYDAMQSVEGLGASAGLTEAVNLLARAKDLVSDYVELQHAEEGCVSNGR